MSTRFGKVLACCNDDALKKCCIFVFYIPTTILNAGSSIFSDVENVCYAVIYQKKKTERNPI